MNLHVEIKRILWITLGTLIFAVGISYFIVPADLIPGGLTGFARLAQYGTTELGLPLNLGIWVVLLNIPIMVLGLKGISKRFVYYSTYSIILQGILIGFFEANPIVVGEEILAMSVLGGGLVGLGAAMTLKSGASTGGIDIVAQYLSLKLQMSIGYIGIIVNAMILGISLLVFDAQFAFYTLVSFIVTNMLIDKLHTAYKRVRLDILSTHGDEIKDAIIARSIRGMTMMNARGAYTGERRKILWMVLQVHEVYDIEKVITDIDPDAFITMTPVHHLNGFFHRILIS
ncbi:MAG: YitT family protein [Bacillota bacterium]